MGRVIVRQSDLNRNTLCSMFYLQIIIECDTILQLCELFYGLSYSLVLYSVSSLVFSFYRGGYK